MNALDINTYLIDGFKPVCKVADPSGEGIEWFYEDINEELLFDEHRSWVYFIVVDGKIWKVGETGNPLGIRYKRGTSKQPLPGSRSRLGRYRNGDESDWVVRRRLAESISDGSTVEFYAKKCPIAAVEVTIAGNKENVGSAVHKDLEMEYLDFIFENTGSLPRLNKARK
jgi:hypothetical protein